MAGIKGPLFSLSARGTIAGTLTYASWRGIPYVRQTVIPANPKSTAQTEVRNIFSFLTETWKRAPLIFQEGWTANAVGRPYTNRNELIKQNIPALQGQADLTAFVWSPGVGGGPNPTVFLPTPIGGGDVDLALNAPTAPTGWTVVAAQCAIMEDGDAESLAFKTIKAGEDLVAPYVVTITGLPLTLHVCAGWLKWLKPDGTNAYSAALQSTVTPT